MNSKITISLLAIWIPIALLSQELTWKCEGNHATYMAYPDGVINVGHSWGGEVWFSDGYTDYIRHFLEGLAAIPEWVPVGNHLLKSTSRRNFQTVCL